MGESLTQRRRVRDEGLRVVNLCQEGRNRTLRGVLTVPPKEAPANYVPAAAARRKGLALSGITGRKERVGGQTSGG
jgi:hypothetical protein